MRMEARESGPRGATRKDHRGLESQLGEEVEKCSPWSTSELLTYPFSFAFHSS